MNAAPVAVTELCTADLEEWLTRTSTFIHVHVHVCLKLGTQFQS